MILYNGQLSATLIDEQHLNNGFCIYEVIRIFQRKPIFLQDNFDRLENSIQQTQFPFHIDAAQFRQKLEYYIRETDIIDGNLKYALLLNKDLSVEEFLFQIPHAYPTAQQYTQGVSTITLHAERQNPNIKYMNNTLRDEANALMKKYKAYEVLLINAQNQITEGSRSNIFFIKGETLYTAPVSQVLPGTSRRRVMEVCRTHGIPTIEQSIKLDNLSHYQAAFISGTSPLILPINSIDSCNFDVANKVLRKVMQIYFDYIKQNG